MAMKADRFPKRFLRCADLKGKPVRLEIEREYEEELTDNSGKVQSKSILSFVGTKKERAESNKLRERREHHRRTRQQELAGT